MKTNTSKILGVRVTIAALAAAIHAEGAYLKRSFARVDLMEDASDPDAFSGTDCRLQVHGGNWQLHTGDSSYDQDHRGAWGCASIPWGCTWKEAREIARELIDDCGDSAAQMGEEEGAE
jgi:hypothetical protein